LSSSTSSRTKKKYIYAWLLQTGDEQNLQASQEEHQHHFDMRRQFPPRLEPIFGSDRTKGHKTPKGLQGYSVNTLINIFVNLYNLTEIKSTQKTHA
jgi:hypothetical protein